MISKILIVASALISVVLAAPQQHGAYSPPPQQYASYSPPSTQYEALGVLAQEVPSDLGEYDRTVAATLDILPEITDTLKRLSEDSHRSNDPKRIQQIMVDLLPITRKVMLATEKAGGATFTDDDYRRLNAAERVMPSVITFMDELRDMDFFGTSSSSSSAPYSTAPAQYSYSS